MKTLKRKRKMDDEKYVGNCTLCGSRTVINISKVGLRITVGEDREEYEDADVLCPRCCGDRNWYSDECMGCSERDICSGMFESKFKSWLDDIKGV